MSTRRGLLQPAIYACYAQLLVWICSSTEKQLNGRSMAASGHCSRSLSTESIKPTSASYFFLDVKWNGQYDNPWSLNPISPPNLQLDHCSVSPCLAEDKRFLCGSLQQLYGKLFCLEKCSP
ncbi:hypothetical protein BDV36DRAFT_111047 [Aspergillus pseudocaelatus]|uniref:Uncharacterized protein n=1 Tax=Aspergillus pseudocaelatus TaxID=1825620 RepID=A0ABQ6WTC3_9EURO|nr:hypothetical protein BDV36DRAFT_111047 [Aspergillus pseudocaelatus]